MTHDGQDDGGAGGSGGDEPPRTDELMALVYDELREVAARYMRQERVGHTLQPTALVHEAYVRLSELDRMQWRDRRQFQIAASGAIRRVLVDHARSRGAAKRGGGRRALRLTLFEGAAETDVDVLALEEALEMLGSLDERKAKVIELRFFGGLTIGETADALGVGTTTVEDDWAFARSWLHRQLADSPPDEPS